MKAAKIVGKGRAEIVEVPDPRPKDEWALVRVEQAPMCNEHKSFTEGTCPFPMGHEAVGVVAEVDRPGKVRVGDRVIVQPQFACGQCWLCRDGYHIHCSSSPSFSQVHGSEHGSGTWAQYLLKPDWLLTPIPEGMSWEHASLSLCALGPTFGAFHELGVSAFDTVLVVGAGPVGLGAVANARYRGARVIVVEKVPYRAARATELGAEHVLDPTEDGLVESIRELTDGRGADVAIDCAGRVEAGRLCLEATRCRGGVAFVGGCRDAVPISPTQDMIAKGLRVIGNWHYNLRHVDLVLQVIQEFPLIDRLISHVMPMSQVQAALEISASLQTAKMILKPWE